MKMHSYTVVNRDYRKNYLETKGKEEKQISNYPNNITLKDFTLYLAYPTLIYMYNFPKTNKKIRWSFAICKVVFFIILWFVGYIIGNIFFFKLKVSDYLIPVIE